VSGTKAVDEDTLVNVTAALRRLKYLFMHSDVRNDLSDPKAFVANLYTFVEAATERLSESGNANVEEVQAASEALVTAHFWFLHTWAECFSNLCSVFSSEGTGCRSVTDVLFANRPVSDCTLWPTDAKPNISRFERLVDEFVATRAPYLACLRLIIEAKPSDEDDLTPDQVEPLKCLQRQAWKQTMEVGFFVVSLPSSWSTKPRLTVPALCRFGSLTISLLPWIARRPAPCVFRTPTMKTSQLRLQMCLPNGWRIQ